MLTQLTEEMRDKYFRNDEYQINLEENINGDQILSPTVPIMVSSPKDNISDVAINNQTNSLAISFPSRETPYTQYIGELSLAIQFYLFYFKLKEMEKCEAGGSSIAPAPPPKCAANLDNKIGGGESQTL